MNLSRILTVVAVAAGLSGSVKATPFFINATFDSSITSDANAATIMATINAALAIYDNAISTPMTVAIVFKEDQTIGLGQNTSYFGTINYNTYRTALASHATDANDASALATLPISANNPVNGSTSIDVTTANLRALGFVANPPGGQPDGTVSLKTSIMNLDRNTIDPSKYDLMAVVMHEIDEVLGIGSSLNGLTQGVAAPTGAVWGMDLYRYATGSTSRSFDTAIGSTASLSINGGVTDLVGFNQNEGGDMSDWLSVPGSPKTQDAFGTPGSTPSFGVELTALDVLGYSTAVPEPSSFVLMSGAVLGLMGLRRRLRS